jgi:hypothetical protein
MALAPKQNIDSPTNNNKLPRLEMRGNAPSSGINIRLHSAVIFSVCKFIDAPSSGINIRLHSAVIFSVCKFIDAPRFELRRHPMDVRGLH